ncbi:MAG: QueT transporter family protein [Clostridia bacterium]|nr:QueT transporter family protein [Clostridia bacterium]
MQNASSQKVTALTRAALVAALYAALTLLLAPISYGEIQIRLSEALTILPVLLPEAVPALAIGCLLANLLGGCTVFDIAFGSLATLLAALCTRALRKNIWLAAAMPVLFNGVIVGAVVHYAYAPVIPLPLCMLFVATGEAVACFAVSPVVLRIVKRLPSRFLA